MTEDMTEFVLNVKGIVAKLHTSAPKTVILDVTGPREVVAGDIKQDSDIEILNADHHLATLSEGGHLFVELTFECGRGYVSQERNKLIHAEAYGPNVTAPIGLIYTDSIYTPVYNVSYNVENTRVGSNIADYDKLTLEVLTNGTITAKEAISLGAKILNEHLNLFVDLSDEAKNAEIMVISGESPKEKVLEMTIEDLDLSVRSFNCLKRAGIDTVSDLSLIHISSLIMWLSEKINQYGIGNGISMILFANIVSGVPSLISEVWTMTFTAGGFKGFSWLGLIFSILTVVITFAIIVFIIWFTESERRIPIQYAKDVYKRQR